MTPGQLAFLSYTRTDDEYFGGYITAFRKTLETAVHVVTGKKTFQIFQDIEGIVVGENWQKKLSEVIHQSSFLVPMLSPLFLNSTPCRDEVEHFLEHERTLKRDDLILPVYFFTSPKIEKQEERNKDPVVKALVARQIVDWREKATVPLKEPAAQKAILELAGNVAKAIERLEVSPTHDAARVETLATDPRLAAGPNLKREQITSRKILWVDDNPNNNLWERRALASYGTRFVLALNTDQALHLLRKQGNFAAIISDLGRGDDPKAGYTLLKRIRKAGIQTPYFIYTSPSAAKFSPFAHTLGAQGMTANPDALIDMVLTAIIATSTH